MVGPGPHGTWAEWSPPTGDGQVQKSSNHERVSWDLHTGAMFIGCQK